MKTSELIYKRFEVTCFKMTKHFLEEREDRIIEIMSKPQGFGTVVKIVPEEGNKNVVVTTSKVAIVMDEALETIITAYELNQIKFVKYITA